MTEVLFYALFSTLPFHLFAYIPFWHHLRFSRRTTILLLLAEQLLYLVLFAALLCCGLPAVAAQLAAVPIYGPLFFYFVNMDRGKIAFLYIFTTDYLMLVSGSVSFLGQTFFHFSPFTWKAGICILLLFFLTMPFMLRYICKTAESVFDIDAPMIWKTVWILPLSTSIMVFLYTYPVTKANVSMLITRTLLMLCMFLIYFYIIQAVHQTQKHAVEKERIRSMEHLIQAQTDHYTLLQSRMQETRRAHHDLRQHWRTLQGFLDNQDIDALTAYVKKYGESLPSESISSYCKNYAINTILHYYAEKAAQEHIQTDISFHMEEKTIIPEPEFCVLLGNLFENALEACITSADHRWIRINARQTGQSMLTLTMDNSSPIPPKTEGNHFHSSKHDGFGIGTASVRMIAEKYQGDARFEWKNGIFFASVLLNPAAADTPLPGAPQSRAGENTSA